MLLFRSIIQTLFTKIFRRLKVANEWIFAGIMFASGVIWYYIQYIKNTNKKLKLSEKIYNPQSTEANIKKLTEEIFQLVEKKFK